MVDFDRFTETRWNNSRLMESVEIFGGFLFFLALFWLMVNIPQGLETVLMIYVVMILVAGLAYAGKEHIAMHTVGFGQNNTAVSAIMMGIVVAFAIIFLNSVFNAAPVSKDVLGVPLALTGGMAVFMVGLVAGYIEEAFFRGTLQPTFSEIIGNNISPQLGSILAILITALLFGGFHYTAYGQSSTLMVSATIFGLVASAGNSYYRSTLFSVVMHITHNLVVLKLAGIF